MSKDLKKYKKIKCDLEMSYAGPYRAVGGKLLAMVKFKCSKNSNILKYSIRHKPGKGSQLRADLELRSAGPARGKGY